MGKFDAYNEITDLAKVFPQVCEEIKELYPKFLSHTSTPRKSKVSGDPLENYENMVSKGHEVIDRVFSTDQAEFFTADAKANDPMNEYAIGMMPLP